MRLHLIVTTILFAANVSLAANTFNPIDYGARPDGKTLATEAIQKAIDACASQGGGAVRLAKGDYLSGTIVLRSGVALELEEGATLLGSTNPRDYPHKTPAYPSRMNNYVTQSLIYAERLERIALWGKGQINGQGAAFRSRRDSSEHMLDRPFLIRMIECKDVTVEGLSLRNSGAWMQSYLACDNLTIRHLNIHNHVNRNNDLIDIDGCQGVHIHDVDGSSDDDGLCFKGTSLRPTRKVVVENCRFYSHCNALKFGTDSQGGLQDVQIRNLELGEPDKNAPFILGRRNGISGMSWEVVDGGTMQNVTVDNIKIRGTCAPIYLCLGDRGRHLKDKPRLPPGVLRDVTISNVEAVGASDLGCPIVGLPDHPIENLTLRNIKISFAGGGQKKDMARRFDERRGVYPEATVYAKRLPAFGLYCWHVKGLTLDNVQLSTLEPDQRPAILMEDATDVKVYTK